MSTSRNSHRCDEDLKWNALVQEVRISRFRFRFVRVKRFTEKYFSKMIYEKIFYGKKKRKKKFSRKMFYGFEISKTFYRKMAWFSVDQKNIFCWLLIFRETNIRKFEKYFSISHFQWNKRTLNIWFFSLFSFEYFALPNHVFTI